MYSHVMSGTIFGIRGMLIQVEADVSDGLPGFHLVGCLSNEIRESGERIRTAMRNSGWYLPPKRVVVNLSPADIRKVGSGFDLPIAIATMVSMGVISQEQVEHIVFLGELGLNGTILPVNGVLSIADSAVKAGCRIIVLSKENQEEASLIPELKVVGVESLQTLVKLLHDREALEYAGGQIKADRLEDSGDADVDFRDLKGQPLVRRAMEIAASGMHNMLMTGPPGAGKTMAAKCLTGILPDLSFDERMELTKIYSVKGLLNDRKGLIYKRPFRSPHHTITASALIGGGLVPKPGEISLAHNGVLFLDELPEFSKNVIEVLRQPLEDKMIRINRLNHTYEFPANIMLIGAMNPCPCGCYPDRTRCHCSFTQIHNYQGRISRAMLDRMDLQLTLQPVSYAEMIRKEDEEDSSTIRKRVEEIHKIQQNRYREDGIRFNSQLGVEGIKKYCQVGQEEQKFLREIFEQKRLSGRAYHRLLKVARTIADMEHKETIELPHLMEAIAFRMAGGVADE